MQRRRARQAAVLLKHEKPGSSATRARGQVVVRQGRHSRPRARGIGAARALGRRRRAFRGGDARGQRLRGQPRLLYDERPRHARAFRVLQDAIVLLLVLLLRGRNRQCEWLEETAERDDPAVRARFDR